MHCASRYQEIAQLAIEVTKQRPSGVPAKGPARQQQPQRSQQQADEGMMRCIAQEMFRVVLFAAFYFEVWVVSFVPVVGGSP